MYEKLVYMNTLKKENEEINAVVIAQVYVFKLKSSWQMNWKMISGDGEMIKDLTLEKKRLVDIAKTLRSELQQHIESGYLPLFSDYYHHSDSLSPKNKKTQLLYFYSEQMTNDELFEQLRGWRREESDKLDKPPFIIASNRVLKMLSSFVPKTKEELMQIPGFASAKTEQYGDPILNITKQFERSTSFPLTWVENHINMEQFDDWLYKNQMMKKQI
ncbi:HRDC domain-containing protein [Chengkuizengella axinellae]|uniref:HRDC domain-containing protein n=1 Tax=Chengkuizengella axinellae TaxID=3064388 RepID=A0ABT9J2F6_9BACL|nr:HRDC domain-containing protein [Chengkuizengella sp. 2205SS18-9]MDP5275190.1 HRDC domain-containing protein [Chengkuizengella sp. 2205SS18-9]